jgi:hypothetical protein
MSRAQYSDDYDDDYTLNLWRGAVESAIRGKRGQAFLKGMLTCLDAMPVKRLIAHELIEDGEVCALGAVGVHLGINLDALDSRDHQQIACVFNIAPAMVREIEYENDEQWADTTSPETRWAYMRKWVADNIVKDVK